MKSLKYQQDAIAELTDKTIRQLNLGGSRRKIVFEAPTGAGKTVMACQTLANIVDELRTRSDSRYKECAFIWFAPRKLHLQSYERLKNVFSETRKLQPVLFDGLEQSEGIKPGEILFINWESIVKKNNIIVRDSESSASLYEITRRTQEEFGLPIIAIIDEEHMFWSNTADKTKAVLNPEIDVNSNENEIALNERLIKAALEKRNQIAEAYRAEGVGINPLLLIQLPNDKKESMTTEDEKVAEQVKTYLRYTRNITEENGKLAVWLSDEKTNLTGLEQTDNLAQVLLFKEAIALGWDCPRAAVLLIFRKLSSDEFTIQTIGRILRMPEQKHYTTELLNYGYVYTDLAKDKIHINPADARYILNDPLTAHRRPDLRNVALKSFYYEKPDIERYYIGPDFRKVLYDTACEFWQLKKGAALFSIAQLAAMRSDNEEYRPLSETDEAIINENRRCTQNPILLDVKNINIKIPKNVHFQNEVQTLTVDRAEFARTTGEINSAFIAYIDGKGGQFERKGRTDKIASFLTELIADLFGIYHTDAQKVVLNEDNRPTFDRFLDLALGRYMKLQSSIKQAANRTLNQYTWEIPAERIYDSYTHKIKPEIRNYALDPFIELNETKKPEIRFAAFLEKHNDRIDWWYKNGSKGKMHYAIPYTRDSGEPSFFYPDFIIRMKSGHIYILDTKTRSSDPDAPAKHNALNKYMQSENERGNNIQGGIIIETAPDCWLYCKETISNTSDLDSWDMFNPQNA